MNWLELHIDTNHPGLDVVTTMLSSLGIDGVVINDETEFLSSLEANPHWDYVDDDLMKNMHQTSRITFYLEAQEEGYSKLGEVRIALSQLKSSRSDCGTLLMTLDHLENADWENNWKQYYKPMEIGERLLVIPSWESVESHGRVPLILDPGLAFGTGSHATTRLCLTALEGTIHGGERVLDLGCGSGILSIAALKLGAATSAVDIDPTCLDVAYENAALNDIGKDTYFVQAGDILTNEVLRASIGGGYHVVLANIVADIIIALGALVRSLLGDGGVFICSGIIDTRAEEVAQHLQANGLEIEDTQASKGWVSYTCR